MHNSISDMLLDAVQNAIEAKASLIILDYQEIEGMLDVYLADNGKGMNEETLKKAIDPFYTDGEKHAKRKVGLGLPFIKQTAEAAGGVFEIDSREDEGTSLHFSLNLGNVDCPPAGSLPALFTQLQVFDGSYELVINRTLNGKKYTVTKSELTEALGSIGDTESLALSRRYFEGQEEEVK